MREHDPIDFTQLASTSNFFPMASPSATEEQDPLDSSHWGETSEQPDASAWATDGASGDRWTLGAPQSPLHSPTDATPPPESSPDSVLWARIRGPGAGAFTGRDGLATAGQTLSRQRRRMLRLTFTLLLALSLLIACMLVSYVRESSGIGQAAAQHTVATVTLGRSAFSARTPTATATPTDRPSPEVTQRPVITPTALTTATPTQTPASSRTPVPTTTPEPTAPPTTPTIPTTPTGAPTATATALPTATATATVKATATPTTTPTPTPTTPPTATIAPTTASVSFTTASQAYTTQPAIAACPNGPPACDMRDTAVNDTATLSESWSSSGSAPTTHVDIQMKILSTYTGVYAGPITVTAHDGTQCYFPWVVIPSGLSETYTCNFSGRLFFPAGDFVGFTNVMFGPLTLTAIYSQPSDSYVTGGWTETTADCNAAKTDITRRAKQWIANDIANKTRGQVVVTSDASNPQLGTPFCSPGVGSHNQAFTVYISATATALAYDPNAVKSVAQSRLNALKRNSWTWRDTVICAPNNSAPTVTAHTTTTISLQCAAKGFAIYTWAPTDISAFANGISGRTVGTLSNPAPGTAYAFCESYQVAGVLLLDPTTCVINAHGASTIPTDPGKIAVSVSIPPTPAGYVAALALVRGLTTAQITAALVPGAAFHPPMGGTLGRLAMLTLLLWLLAVAALVLQRRARHHRRCQGIHSAAAAGARYLPSAATPAAEGAGSSSARDHADQHRQPRRKASPL